MVGYCAMGSVRMARIPIIMITMAITTAKIGRSMKKRDTSRYQPGAGPGVSALSARDGGTAATAWTSAPGLAACNP